MKLTEPEKLILIMLSDIHKALKIKDSVDPDLIAEAVRSGNTWGLPWEYSGVFSADEHDEAVVHETGDILDMWSLLESGYAALDKAGKAKVDSDAAPFANPVRFPGFDGNNECNYSSVASFLTKQLDRHTSLKGRIINSHMPTIDGYRRMLAVFLPMRSSLGGGDLSAGQITAVLNARRHPES